MSDTTNKETQEDIARLNRSPQAIAILQNAQQNLRQGRFAAAVAGYHNFLQQFPNIPHVWAEMGSAAMSDLEFTLATQAFERAAELGTNNSALLVNIGTQFYHLRDLDQAFACLQRAVAVDPSSIHARLTLASWLERSRRLDESWACLDACLAQNPKDSRLLYFKAFLLQAQGRSKEAEPILRDLLNDPALPPDTLSNVNHLLGVILDEFGQYAEALSCLAKSKSLRRKIANADRLDEMYDKMNLARRELLGGLTKETMRRWREEAAASPCPHPMALLGGSPRSGTTLMEQILAANPEVLVFDEPHAFASELLNTIKAPPPAQALTLQYLNELAPAERSRLIGRYFKSLLRETEDKPGTKILLDKNPSTTGGLYIWLRLFPLSKIIVALRDPRDVVISCYFQNIAVNWANVSFLSLERTAKYYANCMDVWLRFRDLGGFDWIETRYEDVVANLETEGKKVTGFLGLPWNDGQATYYESARRKFVHSPTYNEVTKPVYKKKVGRWEHYSEALAPYQAGLQPYLKAFGYA